MDLFCSYFVSIFSLVVLDCEVIPGSWLIVSSQLFMDQHFFDDFLYYLDSNYFYKELNMKKKDLESFHLFL